MSPEKRSADKRRPPQQTRGGSEGIAELMDQFMTGALSRGLSDNQRAAAAWYSANGDIERAHTTGVYLKKAKASGADPILCVYVDSHARMMDFSVMREVYLLRLANSGFSVSGIEFKLSKSKPTRGSSTVGGAGGSSPAGSSVSPVSVKPALPELDPAERRQAEDLAAEVPQELRDKVLRAVEWSMRRQKSEDTSK